MLKQRVSPAVNLSAENNIFCLWPNIILLPFMLRLEWISMTNKSLKIRTHNGKADKTLNKSRAMSFSINNIITDWILMSSWNFSLLLLFFSNCWSDYFTEVLSRIFHKQCFFICRLLP